MAYPGMDLSVMRFKVYFGVSSRSKLIKFLFSRLFCKNCGFRVFCYIRVKRSIISHVETSFSIACIRNTWTVALIDYQLSFVHFRLTY